MNQLTAKSVRAVLVGWISIGLLHYSSPVFGQVGLDCVEIERRIPPVGIQLPQTKIAAWEARLAELRNALDAVDSSLEADVEVLWKACRYAIDHRELYRDQDTKKVDRLLDLAAARLSQFSDETPDWVASKTRQVRGYRSGVDGSVQPLGLVFPEQLPAAGSNETVPLYVWLHGRGDKVTDLHFICDRLDKNGQITPEGAIVLHPFGRQCIGYKSAGETDVMDAIDFVCANYPVDPDRIVLMGFSMGGAGVWHLAAHYSDRFIAASPGAGFAETARYQRLKPDDFPSEYEQTLWGIYDVPGYVRNLFNFPVVAYSGENDKQIQAARVMEEAYAAEGRKLTHLIGPGMGHKYHPYTLAEILQRMDRAVQHAGEVSPGFSVQARHLRYASRSWLTIDGQTEPYADTRADALRDSRGTWSISTGNVARLELDLQQLRKSAQAKGQPIPLSVDDQEFHFGTTTHRALLMRDNASGWKQVDGFPVIRKRPELQGPIDDAFIDPFLVVVPTAKSENERIDQWVDCEVQFLKRRWKSLFRGDLRIKLDHEVTAEDHESYHLILWGTPQSNRVIGDLLAASLSEQDEIRWEANTIRIGKMSVDAAHHVPLLIYPNPRNRDKYVVLNSGPTFRPAHDRTNSLQNPHLPDWALIDLDELPSAERPGGIAHAGFFDDEWRFDPQRTW